MKRIILTSARFLLLASCSFLVGTFLMPISLAAKESKAVTVAMSLTPLSAPFIIAENLDYFAKDGLNVTIEDFIGGNRTADALMAGEADIATSSEAVVMFNSFKRQDFSIICTFVSSNNDLKLLTRKDTAIRSVLGLVGHRVGTVIGTSAQFFLEESLLVAGGSSANVEIVNVNPEDATAALISGDVDAISLWEPMIYTTRNQLGEGAFLIPTRQTYTETFNMLSSNNFATKSPETLASIVSILIKAIDYINKNPEKSQAIVANRLKKDIGLIAATWNDLHFEVSLHQWLITTLESEARWAIERGFVEGHEVPNYMNFINMNTLDQVKPSSITIFR